MKRLLIIFFIIFLFIPTWFTYSQVASFSFQDALNKLNSATQKVTLDNGLRILLVYKPESPTIAIYTKFLVGAVDETNEIAGTAHLLEHMLFKGTPNVGTSDWKRESKAQELIEIFGSRLDRFRLEKRYYQERGMEVPKALEDNIKKWETRLNNLIQYQDQFIIKNEDSYIFEQSGQVGFNAYTSQDVTNYQIQLPKNRLEIWAKMESDRLKNPVLREYYTEREVVIEERRMRTENSGPALLKERFLAAAFEAHPYGRPIIGYPSVIPFLDIQETKNFFHKYYNPSNMVITIVGDLDFQNAEQIVRKYFSDLPKGERNQPSKLMEIQSKGRKEVEVLYPSSEAFMMGWLKPPLPHKDNSAFDVLESILGRGKSSRLYRKLVLEKKLAASVRAYNGNPGERYTNLFTIYIQPKEGVSIPEIEKAIWEELSLIQEKGVLEEEIQRVKNESISEFFRYMDKNSALADTLGYYELLCGDWKCLFKVYEDLSKVSSNDIQRVVKKYLSLDQVTVGILRDSRKQNQSKDN